MQEWCQNKLADLFQDEEIHHRTLFSVVDLEEQVKWMVTTTQEITGNLDEAHTGFLFVVPVLQVQGMGKHRTLRSQE